MPVTWGVNAEGEMEEIVTADIEVAGAPVYLTPPIEIPPNPIQAPSPPDQVMGGGGTPFEVSSGAFKMPAYITPIPPNDQRSQHWEVQPTYDGNGEETGGYENVLVTDPALPYNPGVGSEFYPDTPVVPLPQTPSPGGDKAVVDLPSTPVPSGAEVPAVVTSVPIPGPITGKVAGFDLSQVPLWAWVVGAMLAVGLVARWKA